MRDLASECAFMNEHNQIPIHISITQKAYIHICVKLTGLPLTSHHGMLLPIKHLSSLHIIPYPIQKLLRVTDEETHDMQRLPQWEIS